MANQIQATVYQIDGNPLTEPKQISFLTSDILMRTNSISTIPEVLSSITYYPLTNNQLQEQTFFVSEELGALVTLANTAGTSQVAANVLEINGDPLPQNGIICSFPANAVSMWETIDGLMRVNTTIKFKNKKYGVSDSLASLLAAANAGGGGGGGVSGGGTTNNIAKWSNATTLSDSNLFDDGNVIKSVYAGNDKGIYLDFLSEQYYFGDIVSTDYQSSVVFNGGASGSLLTLTSIDNILGREIDFNINATAGIALTSYSGTNVGFKFYFSSGQYLIGDNVSTDYQTYAIFNGGIASGNSEILLISNDIILGQEIVIDINGTNGIITAIYNGIEKGLKFDLVNDIYYFGSTISNGTTGFKADNNTRLATIGDTAGNGNGTSFGTNDVTETLFASPNLITNAGSLPSGNFLKINVGGTDYLISLNNAG